MFFSNDIIAYGNTEPKQVLSYIQNHIPKICSHTMNMVTINDDLTIQKTFRYQPLWTPPWSLLTVNGVPPTIEETTKQHKDNALLPEGISTLDALLTADFKFNKPIDHLLIYSASKLPKNSVIIEGTDVSEYMRAEISIDISGDVPFIHETFIQNQQRLYINTFKRLNILREIKRYTMLDTYQPILSEVSIERTEKRFGKTKKLTEIRHLTQFNCQS